MQDILSWGIDVVLWLQQLSPTFDSVFIWLSFTGSETFFLLLLPLIAWCISPRIGVRVMILVLLSTYVNAVAKLIFLQPRPFDFDPRVIKIEDAASGGFPSGHTQSTVVFWGYLAKNLNKKWLWNLAFLLVLLVPLSRVYLGAHFPTDLIGGYVVGVVMLLIFLKSEQSFINWYQRMHLALQIVFAILFPTALLAIAPSIDPVIISIVGVLTGCFVGIVLEKKYLKFRVSNTLWKKFICYGLGILGLLAIYIGLKHLFIELEPAAIYRYVRYALVGLHFTFFAPWIFSKLKLV